MKKSRIVYSMLAIAFGVFMFVFGEFDDSPGGQLLGLMMAVLGIVVIIKSKRASPQ